MKPIVKHLRDYTFFTAPDECTLANILHPYLDQGSGLPYSLAMAYVEPGGRTLRHILAVQEVYFILSGTAAMWIDGERHDVGVGSCFMIPAGCEQWLENTGADQIRFLCIVSPPWVPEIDHTLE